MCLILEVFGDVFSGVRSTTVERNLTGRRCVNIMSIGGTMDVVII